MKPLIFSTFTSKMIAKATDHTDWTVSGLYFASFEGKTCWINLCMFEFIDACKLVFTLRKILGSESLTVYRECMQKV